MWASSAIWPTSSTPVGPGPDHDEGEPVGPFLRVGGDLGHLELGEDAVAQVPGILDRLHTGGELGEVVVAEIGVGGARGHHEGVVGQRERPGVRAVGVHGPALQIDVIDIGEKSAHVGFDANGAAQRGGDQTRRQDPRRHLVKQGLEEVVVGAVDERHLNTRVVESVDRVQAPEPAAHDDDPMAVSHCSPPRPVMLLYSMMLICATIIRAVPTVLDLPIVVSGSRVRGSAVPPRGSRSHSPRWPGRCAAGTALSSASAAARSMIRIRS